MNGFNRRGACPSLSEPMKTGDGLLARLVLDSPELTSVQLISVLHAAGQHGSGLVEITSRGNLQFRGLTERSAAGLSDEIGSLDLPYGGIPISIPALAGIDRDELIDPRPLATTIRGAIDTSLRDRLAPKTSVVIDSGGQLPIDGIAADIRLTAIRVDRSVRWLISVGGNAATARRVCVADKANASSITLNLLSALAEKGPMARGRDLSDEELSRFASTTNQANTNAVIRHFSPIGTFALADETCAAGIGLPFGAAHSDDLANLVQEVENSGANMVRLASGRGIIFTGLCDKNVGDITGIAEEYGFVTRSDDPRLAISACAGAPLCASGEFDTRKVAAQICESAPSLLDGSFTLHLSGCEKRCADVTGPRLSIVGRSGNCDLLPELRNAGESLSGLEANSLAGLLGEVAEHYRNERSGNETPEQFIRRHSINRLVSEKVEHV